MNADLPNMCSVACQLTPWIPHLYFPDLELQAGKHVHLAYVGAVDQNSSSHACLPRTLIPSTFPAILWVDTSVRSQCN